MKKIIVVMLVTLISVGGLAYLLANYGKETPTTREQQVDDIVKYQEFTDRAGQVIWDINMTIPDNPSLEAWNANHTEPQQMFGFNKNYYIANMDGSDVRILVYGLEIPKNTYRLEDASIVRSYDGRYVKLRRNNSDCFIFDLKTREKIKTKYCGHFMPSRNETYMELSDPHRMIAKYDLATGEKIELANTSTLEGVPVAKGKFFRSTGSMLVDVNNDRLFWRVYILNNDERDAPLWGDEEKVTLEFQLSDMTYIGRNTRLPINCFERAQDEDYLVCEGRSQNNGHEKNDTAYSWLDPEKSLDVFPQDHIKALQFGKWYFSERDGVTRLRQPYEHSQFDRMEYRYYVITEGPKRNTLDYEDVAVNYYISSALREGFDSVDLRPFMPDMITRQEYEQSVPRVKENLRISCTRSDDKFERCRRFYELNRVFDDVNQVREYMNK